MESEIFEQFPNAESFETYWNENYVPVTYEDVREAFEDFVAAAAGHVFISDYEENPNIPNCYKVIREKKSKKLASHLL